MVFAPIKSLHHSIAFFSVPKILEVLFYLLSGYSLNLLHKISELLSFSPTASLFPIYYLTHKNKSQFLPKAVKH